MRTLLLLPTIALLMLAGCAAKYEAKTDYQLCYDKATQMLVGPAKYNRQAEIKSRGLKCEKYADRIDKEIFAIREAKAKASAPDLCYVNKSGKVMSCF